MKEKTLRKLYLSEIEEFVSRRGTNKVAVRDFLGTVEFNETQDVAIVNLSIYSHLYKWNKATKKAIEDGINRAIKRPIKL